MSRIFVTTFSRAGYHDYGRRFLQGFIEYFPEKEVIHVFDEGHVDRILHPRIVYHDLLDDKEHQAFIARNIADPKKNGLFDRPDGTRGLDYRFQSVRFSHKVFAISSPELPITRQRIWIDADIVVKKKIPDTFFDELLKDGSSYYVAYYLGRTTAWHHSECGFVAYNHESWPGFMREFRKMYIHDKIYDLPEWHDSYVFDHLRRQWESLGYEFKNIAPDIFDPFPKTVLGEYMDHLKGPEAKAQGKLEAGEYEVSAKVSVKPNENIIEILKTCKNRYEQIIKIIEVYKPSTIVEVGTWNGGRAIKMAQEALKHKPKVHYIGFDLFDYYDPRIQQELNTKEAVCFENVVEALNGFKEENPGFTYQLESGNTRETLAKFKFDGKIDLAYIDGGHSIETIRSDYGALKDVAKLIIMDDYYVPSPRGIPGPDITKFGCNEVIKGEKYAILPIQDNYENGTSVQMVLLGEMMEKGGFKHSVDIKTRNSVSDEEIHSNIRYAATFSLKHLEKELERLKAVRPVTFIEGAQKPHGDTLVLIGASEELMDKEDPDYQKTWDELRTLNPVRTPNWTSVSNTNKLVICKTSYKKCLEEGVIPWGCVLLDPRDHVAEKIDPVDDSVIYFVSSMCHPTTWDKLTASNARVIGYHALVGAGEPEVIKEEFDKTLCISGGTTSILRGIALFYHLGFRKMIIYGATSSYKKKGDKPHGRSPKPFINVEVQGRKFITDPEMVAQSKDAEMAVKLFPDCHMDFRGDGMLNHAVAITRKYDADNPGNHAFTDMRAGPWVNAFKTGDIEIEALSIDRAIKALIAREKRLYDTYDKLPDYNSLFNWYNFDRLVE